jgi:superfamily II DNA or RNA helicase
MLSVATASQFLDMGRRVGKETGHGQLEAAVAVYNLLEHNRVAYLADEVGMGKTYVALAALALMRHFKPRTRVLVLAPKENIQKKWIKELKTFTEVCVRYPDLRVKAIQGTPARGLVSCNNLIDLVREVTIDPDRDFFARLTSFSFGLGSDTASWKQTRDRLLYYLPAEKAADFDARDKGEFKDAVGRALCRALPRFDLVIVDEAHNLKAGFRPERVNQASRNRMLGLAFGAHSDIPNSNKVQKLLMLSATPVDDDYRHLWNQLDLFGRAGGLSELKNERLDDEERREAAKRILIRRVTSLDCASGRLTKTEYRREWRRGGVDSHDTAADIDDSQKLAVALVQKKVGEILNCPKFNASFQIGMLASFESFLETRRIRDVDVEEGLGQFDDPDQTDDAEHRSGIDVDIVNKLARDYRRRFDDRELPHPKMDGLVKHLSDSWRSGEKALVFVRRVASVREIKRKLEHSYDAYLIDRLRKELSTPLQPALEAQIKEYRRVRIERPIAMPVISSTMPISGDTEGSDTGDGGTETFFAWFFRGEGPADVFSGANFQQRFTQKQSAVATMFEDNHVAWLLEVEPSETWNKLAEVLGESTGTLKDAIRRLASHYYSEQRATRRGQFHAWQGAVLERLQDCFHRDLARRAAHVWAQRFQALRSTTPGRLPPNEPQWLEEPTFFSDIRRRPMLRMRLWPEPSEGTFEDRFREIELRRELLSGMSRLGHAGIDLYVLAANQLGSLASRARGRDDSGRGLAAAFLDLLEQQMAGGESFRAFHELADAAESFDAIVDANLPDIRQADTSLSGVTREIGTLLSTQQPVGGMAGGINQRLVRQFRMPGYPFVLATTEVLQEGEDLHLFCSRVYHYGLSWTPSSMEQRVGRIDRVRSKTHRQLESATGEIDPQEKLQVFYPHLRQTAEAYQVQTVLERLNRFLELMHKDLKTPDLDQKQLNLRTEVSRGLRDVPAITKRLETAFPVPNAFVGSGKTAMGMSEQTALSYEKLFDRASRSLDVGLTINWTETRLGVRVGTIKNGTRLQPFNLFLRSVDGHPCIRCVSPIGTKDDRVTPRDLAAALNEPGVRVGEVYNQALHSYEFTVEGDVLIWDGCDVAARMRSLVLAVTQSADAIEARLIPIDPSPESVREDLSEEPSYAR